MSSTTQGATARAFTVYALAIGGWPRSRLGVIRTTPERASDDAFALYRRHHLRVVEEHSAEDQQLGRMLGLAGSWRSGGLVAGEG
jgi:hypothetical protein